MRFNQIKAKPSCALLFAIGLLSTVASQAAGRFGGGGDYHHDFNNNVNVNHDYQVNDYHGTYYNGGGIYGHNWNDSAVVVGYPGVGGTNCSTVEQCDADGNCDENQECD